MPTRLARIAALLAALGLALWAFSRSTAWKGEGVAPEAPVAEVDSLERALEPLHVSASSPAGTSRSEALPPDDEASDDREGDQGLVVRVVDPDGKPVDGVPVALFREEHLPDALQTFRRKTDASGGTIYTEAELEQFDSVAIALPLDPLVWAPAVSGTEVVLTTPPLGELRFELVDGDGAPAEVSLAGLVITTQRGAHDWYARLEARPYVERFPLHLDYSFRFSHLGEWRPRGDGVVYPGLTLSDRSRTHRVVLGGRYPVLVGRMLNADGSPFTNSGLFTLFSGERHSNHGIPGDSQGRFRVKVVLPYEPPAERHGQFWMLSDLRLREFEHVLDLSRPLPDEDIPVGDIVLARRPVLVAGELRREDGPVPGFAILHIYERAVGTAEWHRLACRGECGATGRFVMWGVAKPGHDYRIHEAVDFVAQSSSGYFEPGQRDFVLEVGEPAALAVIARLDSDSLLRQLELCARFDENAEMAPEGVRKFPLREATLFPTQLPPGCADVEVLSTSGARLARTEGVMFRSGETTELEFDLRNRLPDIAVTLESDGGAKIGRDARVLYRESESGPYPFVAGKDRDVHRVLTTRQSVDLAILAMGHAPVELDDVSSDVTAVLHAGPTVTIPLPEVLQAWKGGWLLWALFHPKADTLARLMPPRWLAAVLKQEGLVAALPAPGTYHVEWVAMRSHSSGDPVHLGDVKDDVVVGADDERITIPFPLEAWSRFDGADHDD